GDAARFGFGPCRLDLPGNLALEVGPGILANLPLGAMRFELWQRVARPFGGDLGFALVGLGVLEAVAFEARDGQPQQRRRTFLADMPDRLLDQARRLDRITAVAVEDRQAREAGEVRSNVLARRLIFGR